MSECEYYTAEQLAELTGTPSGTWRYWAHIGAGPSSIKLGRRRLWKRTVVRAYLDSLESVSA